MKCSFKRSLILLLLLGLAAGCLPQDRPADVLYLSPIDAPEIWRVGAQGSAARQVTSSGGAVYDFSVWPGGSKIVYAAANALGGTDLWWVGANGGKAHRLLDCGGDRCASAAVSPDGRRIAYARRNASENPGGEPGLARVWLMDAASGDTAALYRDARISCELPNWSPDGAWLACYDPRAAALRVHLLAGDPSAGGDADRLFPTRMTHSGVWTADSSALIYAAVEFAADAPSARITRGSVRSGVTTVLLPNLDVLDIGPPALSPDGKWLVVGVLLPGDGHGKDLWLVNLLDAAQGDPGAVQVLEDDPRYATTACRWSPDGQRFACQQFPIGMADSVPSVVVWDLLTNTPTVLADDAALPAWLR
jgi:Tol biopolymer transport system component